MDWDNLTDEQVWNMIKQLPDADCFPIPSSFYKKFNIPPRNPISMKDFLASGYTIQCATAPKDLPTLVIDKPIKNGLLVEVVPFEDIPVEIVSKPFSQETMPVVLPSLQETPTGEQLKDETVEEHPKTTAEQ